MTGIDIYIYIVIYIFFNRTLQFNPNHAWHVLVPLLPLGLQSWPGKRICSTRLSWTARAQPVIDRKFLASLIEGGVTATGAKVLF